MSIHQLFTANSNRLDESARGRKNKVRKNKVRKNKVRKNKVRKNKVRKNKVRKNQVRKNKVRKNNGKTFFSFFLSYSLCVILIRCSENATFRK
jgi:hypothetical protein